MVNYFVYGQVRAGDAYRQVRRVEKRATAVALVNRFVFDDGWFRAKIVTESGRTTYEMDNTAHKYTYRGEKITLQKGRGVLRTRDAQGVKTLRPSDENEYDRALTRARLTNGCTVLVAFAPHEITRILKDRGF